ncbi:MAG TPA: sigma-70 family RNA polymerase sigma factor [Steroidobacteraceae bacterium]|nr:sigma-70 family RNA polymerase sigma factor [Steroidobacteraceae bacterium]
MAVGFADEEWLTQRARRGDLDAFNTIVVRYQSNVYNLCLRMLASREVAEDIAQDTFLLAYRGIGRFQGGNLRAWLLRIAANACYDELRRRHRRPTTSLDALEERSGAVVQLPLSREPSPEDEAIQAELRREIERGLLTLPEEQRLSVILCDAQGLSYDEIAEVMRTSLGTVKSRVSRGRARLREFLRDDKEPNAAIQRQEE